MKSVSGRSAALGALLVLVAAGAARASTVEVKVPFPFLVQGRTLPAGEYRVESVDRNPAVLLIRGEKGNHTSMYVLTTPGADVALGEKPTLTFTRDETQYRLTDVREPDGLDRQIARP